MLARKRARPFEGMGSIVAVRSEGIGRVQPVVTLAFEIVSFYIFDIYPVYVISGVWDRYSQFIKIHLGFLLK